MRRLLLAALATLLLVVPTLRASELSAADLDRRRKALRDLLAERWEWTLAANPEMASFYGETRYNDRLADVSQAAVQRRLAETRRHLARIRRIDTTGFSQDEKIDKLLLEASLTDYVDDAWMKDWEMPLNQMSGFHLLAAMLPGFVQFRTVKDYDDFATRMHAFPKQVDDTIANLRAGMRDHLVPPKHIIDIVAKQIDGLAATAAETSPWYAPLEKFPASVPESERTRIRAAWLQAINRHILPSYRKLGTFVNEEYAAKGRTEPGIWSLPDGARRYATAVKRRTTTDLTPEEIHATGLREVARIEQEMLAIAQKQGFDDVKSFNAAIESNPALRVKSAEELIEAYRTYEERMTAVLPQLFGRLPKSKLDVVPMDAFMSSNFSGASYDPGTPHGARPGRVNVNTTAATTRKTIAIEATAYHEGVPGHHLQLSIGQELPGLPPFRQYGESTVFVEGWGLYAERLGKDVGFYSDPYNDYGRLQNEMLRAIRLVVDTGLNAKHWTREQVVQYFHDHTALDEIDIQNETDKYMVWPAQAVAYKLGELKILSLREEAKKQLGSRFDIRAFHDTVLGAGSIPLNVLELRIREWLAAQ